MPLSIESKNHITALLPKLIRKESLEAQEAKSLMQAIMTGEAGEIITAAVLTALAIKGETGTEIASFAKVMRKAAQAWPSLDQKRGLVLCDTCGTGGDGAATLNISTLAAFVLAALDIPIAKHGNRAVSSKSGSADLLEALGLELKRSAVEVAQCLQKAGITFLFAPHWHPAMKYAAPIRKALGIRTVFNLLGPITNPAPISHQLVGVFHRSFQQPLAEALAALGRQAYVVCSSDGLDEVSWSATTHFVHVAQGKIQESGELSPPDFGLESHSLTALKVSGVQEAARRSLSLLQGKGSKAENQAVAMNAALVYALVKDSSLKEAAQACLETIHSGAGFAVLELWRSC